jgi:hypothetical protein
MAALASRLAPVVVPHAGGSYAAPLLVTTDGAALPVPQVGVPYAASLEAIGGTPPYAWSVTAGSLPAGLALDAAGQLAGTPTSAGPATFTVQVRDSAGVPGTTTRSVTLTVQPGPTTVQLQASSPEPVYGQPLTLVATVSPDTSTVPAPSGTVTFRDRGTAVGTGILGDGTAMLGLASLAVGSHLFTATYPGDSNYQGSGSAGLAVTVGKASTSTVLGSSATPSAFGQPVTFSVVVSAVAPGAGVPSGTVVFRDGEAELGTKTLSGGAATLTVSSLAVGAHAVSATYGGDGSFAASASPVLSQTVNLGGSVTALAVSPSTSTVGQTVTLTATVSPASPASGTPTGTVTFRDGTTVLGTATLSSGVATLAVSTLQAGVRYLTATYGGDGRFAGSASAAASVTVQAIYAFTGFLTPLTAAGTLASPTYSGTQRFGSAIPVKWQLRDGSGAVVTRLSSTRLLEALPNPACAGAPPAGSVPLVLYSPTNGATGGSTFRLATDTFIFNWDTSSGVAKGCYNIVLSLDDGTQKATIVKLQ